MAPDDGSPGYRTELSEDRTILANDRTFAAWSRTGLAALATGVVVARLAPTERPPWAMIVLGSILAALGALMQVTGLLMYLRTRKSLGRAAEPIMVWFPASVALALMVVSLVIAVLLLIP